MTGKDAEKFNALMDTCKFNDWGIRRYEWESAIAAGRLPLTRPEHYYNVVELCPEESSAELDLWERLKGVEYKNHPPRRARCVRGPKSSRGTRAQWRPKEFRCLSHVKKKADRRLLELQSLLRFYDPDIVDARLVICGWRDVAEMPLTAEMAYKMLPESESDVDFIVVTEKRQGEFVIRGIFDTRELNLQRVEVLRSASFTGVIGEPC